MTKVSHLNDTAMTELFHSYETLGVLLQYDSDLFILNGNQLSQEHI